jgi:SAM-dependent methyltransferase
MPSSSGDAFGGGRDQWLARLGRLRNVTRQELVTRQLARHLPSAPARVIDVGAGQGTQALVMAGAGLDVLAVDPDPDMRHALEANLAVAPHEVASRIRVAAGGFGALPQAARPAGFDVVCCHGVLMYLDDPAPALAELASLVAPGGLLSLVFRNADGMALRPGLRRDWAQVHELLDAAARPDAAYRNEIGVDARADHLHDVEAALARAGLRTEEWYGVRVATDGADPDEPAPTGQELRDLLDAEDRLGRTDPYRQVGTLLHLLSRRS